VSARWAGFGVDRGTAEQRDTSGADRLARVGVQPGVEAEVSGHAGEGTIVSDDGVEQLPPQRMAFVDAEVAADVGEDGADGAAADLLGYLRGRGKADGVRGGFLGGRRGFGAGLWWGADGGWARASRPVSLASRAAARCRPRIMPERIWPKS
jgi:hypothetical protein